MYWLFKYLFAATGYHYPTPSRNSHTTLEIIPCAGVLFVANLWYTNACCRINGHRESNFAANFPRMAQAIRIRVARNKILECYRIGSYRSRVAIKVVIMRRIRCCDIVRVIDLVCDTRARSSTIYAYHIRLHYLHHAFRRKRYQRLSIGNFCGRSSPNTDGNCT